MPHGSWSVRSWRRRAGCEPRLALALSITGADEDCCENWQKCCEIGAHGCARYLDARDADRVARAAGLKPVNANCWICIQTFRIQALTANAVISQIPTVY